MTKEERVLLVERIAEQLTDACDMDSLSDKMLLSEIKESGYDIIGNVGND